MRNWFKLLALLVTGLTAGSWMVATQPQHDVTAPGEFEKQEALVVAAHWFVRDAPNSFVRLVQAASQRAAVIVLVADDQDRQWSRRVLTARGVSLANIRFLDAPHTTMWVRDYGPVMVVGKNGRPYLVDSVYARNELAERYDDELVTNAIAGYVAAPVIKSPLSLDGGNILTNGEGLCVVTRKVVDENSDRGFDQKEVAGVMRRCYGMKQVLFVEPLQGEGTGHADVFLTFTSPDTVVVGSYDPTYSPINADILNLNAALLSKVHTSKGPLRVVRIPMPSNTDGQFRTYTNVVYANGLLLMPSYADEDPDKLRLAVETYTQLLPGWEIAQIPATELIRLHGSLRCVMLNLPRLGQAAALVPRTQQGRSS